MDFIIERRYAIEHELSRNLKLGVLGHDTRNKFSDDTPIVVLLLGGDSITLRALCRCLNQGTPLVIVK
ncbi:unnamed protein product, partial [Rotaria sp. Silwood2]